MTEARDRIARLQVGVNSTERAYILANAKAGGLSVSAYLRNIGMGYEVRSMLDHEHVMEIMRVRGDLGRAGGLLKLWLLQRQGEGATFAEVRAVLVQIEAAQAEVRLKVRSL